MARLGRRDVPGRFCQRRTRITLLALLAIVGATLKNYHGSFFPLTFVGKSRVLAVRVPAVTAMARGSSAPKQGHSAHETISRRGSALLGAVVPLMSGSAGAEEAATDSVAVYFGQGSFWPVQHNVTLWSLRISKAGGYSEGAFSPALAGYAGGKGKDNDGKICYTTLNGLPYDKMGYAEVVGLEMPAGAIEEMSRRYFDEAILPRRPGPKDGLSGADFQIKSGGSAYRSVMGLPGGMSSDLLPAVERGNAGRLKLVEGTGEDPDTLNEGIVYVYDTKEFPFTLAELSQQYHDDMSQVFSGGYKGLKGKMQKAGVIKSTGCAE